MMQVSRKEAEQIAVAYVGKRVRPFAIMHVLDIDETGLRKRDCLALSDIEACWVAYVPDVAARASLNPSRIICILKKTGEVVYDGSEGGRFGGWVAARSACGAQKAALSTNLCLKEHATAE